MSTNDYQVTGMSCGHCETAVREDVSEVPGVTAVEVSAASGRLTVTTSGQVDDEAVLAAVDEAGYTAARS